MLLFLFMSMHVEYFFIHYVSSSLLFVIQLCDDITAINLHVHETFPFSITVLLRQILTLKKFMLLDCCRMNGSEIGIW